MLFTEQTIDELWKTLCILNEGTDSQLSRHEKKVRDILEDFFGEVNVK